MICLALRREAPNNGVHEWLITNGMNMGRWTSWFGVNCLADISDCKQFVRNKHIEFSGSTVHQFEVKEIK